MKLFSIRTAYLHLCKSFPVCGLTPESQICQFCMLQWQLGFLNATCTNISMLIVRLCSDLHLFRWFLIAWFFFHTLRFNLNTFVYVRLVNRHRNRLLRIYIYINARSTPKQKLVHFAWSSLHFIYLNFVY